MNLIARIALLIMMTIPFAVSAEEILGLGEIKIGSTQQQVRQQMLRQNLRPLNYDGEDGGDNYIGWNQDRFDNVSLTKSIHAVDIILYYHNDYLYMIQASDRDEGTTLNELFEGFQYKYGGPTKSIKTVLLDNEMCGSIYDVKDKQVQESYIFNPNSNITATAWKATEYHNNTGNKCSDSNSNWSNFMVSDNNINKIAVKLSLEYEAQAEKKIPTRAV